MNENHSKKLSEVLPKGQMLFIWRCHVCDYLGIDNGQNDGYQWGSCDECGNYICRVNCSTQILFSEEHKDKYPAPNGDFLELCSKCYGLP